MRVDKTWPLSHLFLGLLTIIGIYTKYIVNNGSVVRACSRLESATPFAGIDPPNQDGLMNAPRYTPLSVFCLYTERDFGFPYYSCCVYIYTYI